MAHIKRLERLVTVLERVQADPKKRARFDMGSWSREVPECGTVMCAVGWGATDPVLKRQGLRLVDEEISYEAYVSFEAVAKFFELTWLKALLLFQPTSYDSNTDMAPVIARIKAFIRDAKKAQVSQ